MFYLQSFTWRRLTWRRLACWLGIAFLLAGGIPRGAAGQAPGNQTPSTQALLERGGKAGADVGRMQAVAQRARRAGLSGESTASLLRPAVRLAEQGLPSGPLLAKTLEGLAKGVPLAHMKPALRRQRIYTEQAGGIVGQWVPARKRSGAKGKAPGELITAAAEALREGARAADIEALLNGLLEEARRPASTRQVAAATAALPDLLGAGSSPETARQLLTSAIQAGYGPESLQQLPRALRSARQESRRPVGALAEGAARAIGRGAPATRMLRGLFPGELPGGGLAAGIGPPGTTPGTGKPPSSSPPGRGLTGNPDPPGGRPGEG